MDPSEHADRPAEPPEQRALREAFERTFRDLGVDDPEALAALVDAALALPIALRCRAPRPRDN